jgi:2-dehydropantoate 2-reductase
MNAAQPPFSPPRIAILGPGGVGGFVAASLARTGMHVLVIAREPTAAVIASDGIVVRSVAAGDFTARPRASATLRAPVELLLIATKATGLDQALARVQATPGAVVPLLNGLDHMDTLRERFGAGRVAAGVIRIEADRPAPGQIVQTSPSARIDLAADDSRLREPLHRLATALTGAGIPVSLGSGEAQILWSKLVRICALACTTTASGRRIGAIRSDPEWRATLLACVEEAAGVANADGARIDPGSTIAELDGAHPDLGSSLQRDIAAGRPSELDAIVGSVLRACRRRGLACPTISGLYEQIAARLDGPASV